MQNMEQGLPASAVPRNSFNLGGPANGKPGFYNWDLKDFGPRVAAAWSPRGHSGLAKSLFGEGFPGQVGNHNNLHGDGFAGLDLGLSKRWKMPWKESHSLQIRWKSLTRST